MGGTSSVAKGSGGADHSVLRVVDPLENTTYEAEDLSTLVDPTTGIGTVSSGRWVRSAEDAYLISNRPSPAIMEEERPESAMSRGTFRRLSRYPVEARISITRGGSVYEFTGHLTSEEIASQLGSLFVYAQLRNLDMEDEEVVRDVGSTLQQGDTSDMMRVQFGLSVIELTMMDTATKFLLIPLKVTDPTWIRENNVFGQHTAKFVVGTLVLAVIIGNMVTLVDDKAHCATQNYTLCRFEWHDPVT